MTCAGTLRCRGDKYERGLDPLGNASPFIGSKKECPVFDDWSAERSPELVLIGLRFVTSNTIYGRQAIRVRIELCIAKELVKIAVDRVASRFRDHVHH